MQTPGEETRNPLRHLGDAPTGFIVVRLAFRDEVLATFQPSLFHDRDATPSSNTIDRLASALCIGPNGGATTFHTAARPAASVSGGPMTSRPVNQVGPVRPSIRQFRPW